MDNPDHRLIVYGSLAPGEANHYLLGDLSGTWEPCVIRGHLGEYWGFKAFHYDENGPEHPAWLFTSKALPEEFPELDAFEGEGYRRRIIPARVGRRRVLANIYEGRIYA
ncbi:MAG: gamma-glutamylcyclotransferase [Deltaproteobacteria bacterium]|nr:gamma-glutamylcyclotransferase [Deltaproteobacteria bacterium]